MGATQSPTLPVAREAAVPSAVVWINGRMAYIAAVSRDQQVSTCEISRGCLSRPAYLAQVVRVIGDRQRVLIFGPGSVRQALEREYVKTFGRPARLVDVEPDGVVSPEELIDRLHTLAA